MTGTMKPPVLVLGATGIVGRGIVRALLAAATPVVAVARDAGRLRALAAAHGDADLAIVPGSVADEAAGARLARAVRELGRPLGGVVVAIAGPAGRGRLLDQPATVLCAQLCADLAPHLAAARALLPLLAGHGRGGSYVLIGGPGSDLPWSGYGSRSVASAALRMLARVLHDEALPMGVRVQLLSVDAPVAHGRHARAQWPTAEEIGRRALALIERTGAPAADPVVACATAGAPAASPSWLRDARALLQTLTPSIPTEVPPHETP